jgi:hypothetical protein
MDVIDNIHMSQSRGAHVQGLPTAAAQGPSPPILCRLPSLGMELLQGLGSLRRHLGASTGQVGVTDI